jgi:hypothetical protein
MTQFYHVHPSFFNHCIRTGIEAPDFEANRLVPIKFFQKTGQASYSGLLVTGSRIILLRHTQMLSKALKAAALLI